MDQAKFVAAMGYPPDLRRDYCATFFICGSPNETDAGSKPYAKPDLAAAKQALGESGYKGEKIVVMLPTTPTRSEEHTSELQSLMRISYAVFCLKKKTNINKRNTNKHTINQHTKHT